MASSDSIGPRVQYLFSLSMVVLADSTEPDIGGRGAWVVHFCSVYCDDDKVMC